jgi:hypothetical protein
MNPPDTLSRQGLRYRLLTADDAAHVARDWPSLMARFDQLIRDGVVRDQAELARLEGHRRNSPPFCATGS